MMEYLQMSKDYIFNLMLTEEFIKTNLNKGLKDMATKF